MINLINIIFNVFYYAIIVNAILSWFYTKRTNQYIELLHKVTKPLLQPGKKIQDKYFNNMMVDFSPIIALFILMIIKNIVFSILGIMGI